MTSLSKFRKFKTGVDVLPATDCREPGWRNTSVFSKPTFVGFSAGVTPMSASQCYMRVVSSTGSRLLAKQTFISIVELSGAVTTLVHFQTGGNLAAPFFSENITFSHIF